VLLLPVQKRRRQRKYKNKMTNSQDDVPVCQRDMKNVANFTTTLLMSLGGLRECVYKNICPAPVRARMCVYTTPREGVIYECLLVYMVAADCLRAAAAREDDERIFLFLSTARWLTTHGKVYNVKLHRRL
jgi:hypothetical protein